MLEHPPPPIHPRRFKRLLLWLLVGFVCTGTIPPPPPGRRCVPRALAAPQDDTLSHLTDLYKAEWAFFCERAMLKAPPLAVVTAFFAADRSLARLWVKQWLVGMKKLQVCP